jgi:hypothetical protein
MTSMHELIPTHGAVAACQVLGLPRGAPARHLASQRQAAFVGPRAIRRARPPPPMALDALENQVLLDTVNSERFVDTAPAAVHATLLDEGRYLGSVRTMYRLLARTGGSRERRNQLVHPAYIHQARAAGNRSQPGLVLGHHPSCADRSSGRTFTCTWLATITLASRRQLSWPV